MLRWDWGLPSSMFWLRIAGLCGSLCWQFMFSVISAASCWPGWLALLVSIMRGWRCSTASGWPFLNAEDATHTFWPIGTFSTPHAIERLVLVQSLMPKSYQSNHGTEWCTVGAKRNGLIGVILEHQHFRNKQHHIWKKFLLWHYSFDE